MHSFSLCRYGRPNRRVIRRFNALLAWLRTQPDIEICTVEQFCRYAPAAPLPQPSGSLPVTGLWLTWGRAMRAWNDGWKNLLVAALGVACLVLGVIVLGSILYLLVAR